jgi:hypothetical protein
MYQAKNQHVLHGNQQAYVNNWLKALTRMMAVPQIVHENFKPPTAL